MKKESSDKFGKFIIQEVMDKGFERFDSLRLDQLNSPDTLTLRNGLKTFTLQQKQLVEDIVTHLLIHETHDLLFALEERNDLKGDIEVVVDGVNICEESDGLNGELFSQDGWIQQFSKYADRIKT